MNAVKDIVALLLIAHICTAIPQFFDNQFIATFAIIGVSICLYSIMFFHKAAGAQAINWGAVVMVIIGVVITIFVLLSVFVINSNLFSEYWKAFISSILTIIFWILIFITVKGDAFIIENKKKA